MNILLLAPHPFYQERGTPIAVNLLLKALSRLGHTVDVLTYHEGSDVTYPNVTIHRITPPPFARNVPPGPSLKKILCDLYMLPKALSMARRKPYDLVHAIEESVYMAMLIRRRRGIPYFYDMDSSLAHQIAEKFSFLGFLLPIMTRTERAAIRGALAVVPVCDALARIAKEDGATRIVLLRDISLLSPASPENRELVRKLVPGHESLCFMYIGNLEAYQGIDFMLDSFSEFLKTGNTAHLVIAGGQESDILRYRAKTEKLGIAENTLFLGPQPVSRMSALFEVADVLISPRITGNNTPMKIYSYLASGKSILATTLPTHTQILTSKVALLVPPDIRSFAGAMKTLVGDKTLRLKLAAQAQELARTCHSQESFQKAVEELYAEMPESLT